MHGTAWAVLLLVCVPWVSPQELVLATNDDDPPHAAPPSPFSSPPSSPYQPAHPPPPMAATPNATALEVSCGGLAAYVYTECSAIPGRYVCSESPSFQCCAVYPLPTHVERLSLSFETGQCHLMPAELTYA